MTMNRLDEIMTYNECFVKNENYKVYETDKHPSKKILILSCMDTRLTELLPKAMNLKNGDAKLVKNAGATIVHPFGSIMRSIILAIYEFSVEDIIVVGHYGCGMSNLNSESMIEKMKQRGISEETISTLINAGIDIKRWLHGFGSEIEAVKESVKSIKSHPLVPQNVRVHGLIMDPATGKLDKVMEDNRS